MREVDGIIELAMMGIALMTIAYVIGGRISAAFLNQRKNKLYVLRSTIRQHPVDLSYKEVFGRIRSQLQKECLNIDAMFSVGVDDSIKEDNDKKEGL